MFSLCCSVLLCVLVARISCYFMFLHPKHLVVVVLIYQCTLFSTLLVSFMCFLPQSCAPLWFALSMDRKSIVKYLASHDEIDVNTRNVCVRMAASRLLKLLVFGMITVTAAHAHTPCFRLFCGICTAAIDFSKPSC
jgi:hypothetical protein